MIAAILPLALLAVMVVAMLYDFDCAYDDAQREALLDELWDDSERPVLEVVS